MASRVNSWPTAAPLDGTEIVACEHSNTYKAFTASELATYTQAASSVQLVTTLTSAAIQTAIDTAAAAGGGIVQLVEGDYVVSDFIEVKDNVTLRGVGKDATTLVAPGTPIFGGPTDHASGVVGCLGTTNCVIEDLTVDMVTNGGTGTNGIVFTGATSYNDANTATYCTVQRCKVLLFDDESGASGYAIWNRLAKYTRILNNVVIGPDTSYDSDSQNEGIEVFGGEDVLIDGNYCEFIGNAGIFVTTATGSNAVNNKRITITNNHITKCAQGIAVSTTAVNTGTNYITDGIIISNNQVIDCFAYCCRVVQALAANAATDVAAAKVLISNNTFEITDGLVGASDIIPLWIGQDGALNGVWRQCLITDNLIRGGEAVFGSSVQIRYVDGCTFSGNIVSDNSTANGSSYAVYLLNAEGVTLESNKFENIHSSVLNASGADSLSIKDNQFVNIVNNNGLHTVYLNGTCDGAVVTGNVSEHKVGGSIWFVNGNTTNTTNFYAYGNKYINNHTIQQINFVDTATANFGTVSSGASTTATITNQQITIGSFVSVHQSTGTPEAFTVAITDGTATITKAGSTDLSYDYLII